MDTNINFEEAMTNAKEITNRTEDKVIRPAIVENYEGPGIVVNKDEVDADLKNKQPMVVTGVVKDSQDNFSKTLQGINDEIAEEKRLAEELLRKKEEMAHLVKDEEEVDERTEKINEVIVLLDKQGIGSVIFDDQEKEKLKKSKVIHIKEVENVNLDIKVKKGRPSGGISSILKRNVSFNNTSIVLPNSGYTAVIKGCSPFEITALRSGENVVDMMTNKWSLIHSKIVSTSIGDMDYDTFLKNTSYFDDSVFIYGILCATFPDVDSLDITCPACKKSIDFPYAVKGLLRAERMNDKTVDIITNIIDNSFILEDAKRVHEESEVCTATRIRLPDSNMIVDMRSKNVYEFINSTLTDVVQRKGERYSHAIMLSSTVSKIFIEDLNDGMYYEIDSTLDIIDILYQLSNRDIIALSSYADKIGTIGFEFGISDVECPHCHKKEDYRSIDIERLLFIENQRAMEVTVE
ncbi:MAG: hypothetical protein PHF63_00645 [Herbinix sp.]|nr:hypothetical protein [Herbinix sp.]